MEVPEVPIYSPGGCSELSVGCRCSAETRSDAQSPGRLGISPVPGAWRVRARLGRRAWVTVLARRPVRPIRILIREHTGPRGAKRGT
jgi:hypothetical protein